MQENEISDIKISPQHAFFFEFHQSHYRITALSARWQMCPIFVYSTCLGTNLEFQSFFSIIVGWMLKCLRLQPLQNVQDQSQR